VPVRRDFLSFWAAMLATLYIAMRELQLHG
jgi:hypothetical protein